jgi:hypothetical protein
MLFEDILILLAAGAGLIFVGIPGYKILRLLFPKKRDTLKEAQERLQQARIDLEAAKLDKQTSEAYDNLYKESLEDDEVHEDKNKGGKNGY